jgi:hypothetical protein
MAMQSNWYRPVFDKVPDPLVKAIVRHMIPPGRGIQYIAEYEDRIVAASLFFIYGTQAIYWANTVTDEGRRTNANYLLMWEAIKTLKRRGCKTLNFGASPDGAETLIRFKRSWKTTPYYYSKYQTVPVLMRPAMAVRGVLYG